MKRLTAFLADRFYDLLEWSVRGKTSPYLPQPMTITPDHWLAQATRQPLAGGSIMSIRRFLVIHFTGGATGQSSIDYWQKLGNGICAHLVIDRDGSIIQCRPFDHTAGHAGASQWRDPKTGRLYTGLNSCAIGIELANAGDDAGALSWAARQPSHATFVGRHKNGGPTRTWEAYPQAQLVACEQVSKALVARYHLDDIVGHDDIAPERKNDPGPAFPMQVLRNACGFLTPLPKLRN